MSLVLVNSVYRLHNIKVNTAQDFACEGLSYYSPEASGLRYKIFCETPEPDGCAAYTVDNCAANKLFGLRPDLFFFPDTGLSSLLKAQLVNWLISLQTAYTYQPESVATAIQFIDFQPGFQDTLECLIEFLEAYEVVYAQ